MRTRLLSASVRLFSCALFAASLTSTGCATNPARQLESNAEVMRVDNDGYFRGDEKLDEEEFYTLAGDAESAQKIHDSRSMGELEQMGAVALVTGGVVVGLAGIGGYLALLNNTITIPEGYEILGSAPLYIGVLGLVAVGGGVTLFGVGHEQALGTFPMFDKQHAQASLEKGLYGEGGAKPESVASFSFATSDGAAHVCSANGIGLTEIAAKDAKGRPLKLDGERASWFTWTSKPDGLLVGSGLSRHVVSPIAKSLADVDKDVLVSATIDSTGVKHELSLPLDVGCSAGLNFSGEWGSGGSSGSYGSSGGGAGGDGGPGGNGERGPNVEAEAAWVNVPKHGKLLLVAASTSGEGVAFVLVDPAKSGTVVVSADGGGGGSGGSGGRGGDGQGYYGSECRLGGNGGNGGRGGVGGNGGDGGKVTLRVADKSIEQYVKGSVSGGSGGSAGSGGSYGSGGNSDSCGNQSQPRGADGANGPGGASGQSGRSGSVDKGTAPAGSLKLIAKVLASNPAVTLAK